MRCQRPCQRDLFDPEETMMSVPPPLLAKLAPLLQALLTEAAGIERVGRGEEERGDDQDHV